MADASDSKSDAGDSVWVRVPPAALFRALITSRFFFMFSFYLNRSLRKNMDYSPDVHTSFKFKQYNNGIR